MHAYCGQVRSNSVVYAGGHALKDWRAESSARLLMLAAFLVLIAATASAQPSSAAVSLVLARHVTVELPNTWSVVVNQKTMSVDQLAARRIALYDSNDDPQSVRQLLNAFVKQTRLIAAVNIVRTEGGHEGHAAMITADFWREIEAGSRLGILKDLLARGCAVRWLPTKITEVLDRSALEMNYVRTCNSAPYRVRQTSLSSRYFGIVVTQSSPLNDWAAMLEVHNDILGTLVIPP